MRDRDIILVHLTQINVKPQTPLHISTDIIQLFFGVHELLIFIVNTLCVGELDAFLEDTEADEMEAAERAEFIKYLISRGMFDKAYYWLRSYGVADVEPS